MKIFRSAETRYINFNISVLYFVLLFHPSMVQSRQLSGQRDIGLYEGNLEVKESSFFETMKCNCRLYDMIYKVKFIRTPFGALLITKQIISYFERVF